MASDTENWNDCPRGTLVDLGGRLRGETRRRQLAQSAMTAALMALLVVGAGLLTALPWNAGGGTGSPFAFGRPSALPTDSGRPQIGV